MCDRNAWILNVCLKGKFISGMSAILILMCKFEELHTRKKKAGFICLQQFKFPEKDIFQWKAKHKHRYMFLHTTYIYTDLILYAAIVRSYLKMDHMVRH